MCQQWCEMRRDNPGMPQRLRAEASSPARGQSILGLGLVAGAVTDSPAGWCGLGRTDRLQH